MNTQDLLEHASLDALGLLDEQERTDFETAFRGALPAVQSQVRREQARFAASDSLLPSVEVPAGLKFRVMSAVRDAVQSFNRVEAVRRAEHTPFLRNLMWNSTPLWRAACIGFATATVVLGVFFSYVSERVQTIERMGLTVDALEEQMHLSPGLLEAMLAGQTTQQAFVPLAPEADAARALIMINPDTGEAHLIVDNLPVAGAEYALVALGENEGEYTKLHAFDFTSIAYNVRAKLDTGVDLTRLAIVGPAIEGGASVIVMALG